MAVILADDTGGNEVALVGEAKCRGAWDEHQAERGGEDEYYDEAHRVPGVRDRRLHDGYRRIRCLPASLSSCERSGVTAPRACPWCARRPPAGRGACDRPARPS